MYDFRKSGLYKHMKFRDVDEAILDGVKQFLDEKAAQAAGILQIYAVGCIHISGGFIHGE